MNNGGITFAEDLETLLDSFDDYEYDESSDYDESELLSEKRAALRPVKAAPPKTSFKPRPSQYITQTQLQTTVAKIDGRISTLAKDTSQQVNTVKREQAKQVTILKKEIADRKKEAETARKELRQFRDISMLLPLISKPSSQTLTAEVGGLPAGTKVMVDKDDTMSMLLPLVLMGGLGGSSGGSDSGSGFGGDNNMMMLVLLMTLGKR
jgi:hypothetical protein